jgi:hypothetical protein
MTFQTLLDVLRAQMSGIFARPCPFMNCNRGASCQDAGRAGDLRLLRAVLEEDLFAAPGGGGFRYLLRIPLGGSLARGEQVQA